MKNIFISVLFLAFSTSLYSQTYRKPERIFGKHQLDIQFGAGVLPVSRLLDNATIKMLPLSLEVNRMINDHFSLGVYLGRFIAQSRPVIVSDGVSQRVTNHSSQTALKGAVHVTRMHNADLYGGFQLALTSSKFSVDKGDMDFLKQHLGIKSRSSKVTYTGFVGGRYALSSYWNVFGEIGFGESVLTAGVGYRIK